MKQSRVMVVGSGGRMGRQILSLIEAASDLKSVSAIDQQPDILIDFSSPDGTRQALHDGVARKIPLVIGTTGLTADDHVAIDAAAKHIAVLQSPNMSIAVAELIVLAADAAMRLGAEFDIEIVESHHRGKKDAPSGTAVALADAVASSGSRTKPAIHSIRMGDDVGRHTVILAGTGERLELSHTATNRDVFAIGALRAAHWLLHRTPGRYTIADVLKS